MVEDIHCIAELIVDVNCTTEVLELFWYRVVRLTGDLSIKDVCQINLIEIVK